MGSRVGDVAQETDYDHQDGSLRAAEQVKCGNRMIGGLISEAIGTEDTAVIARCETAPGRQSHMGAVNRC